MQLIEDDETMKYTDEFRKKVVEYYQTHTYLEIQTTFHISPITISRWVKKFGNPKHGNMLPKKASIDTLTLLEKAFVLKCLLNHTQKLTELRMSKSIMVKLRLDAITEGIK